MKRPLHKNVPFQSKSDDLDQSPDSMEELKNILRTITDIKNMSLVIETSINNVQERYRVIGMYKIEVRLYRD